MKTKKNNKLIGTLFSLFFLLACTTNDVFLNYQTINKKGWSEDSLCVFNTAITDSVSKYNVYINIRNKGDYPYQNLWLYINSMSPDSTITTDTIELYLADQRGKWLGSGIGSVFEMPVLYQQNKKFKKAGIYKYSIIHGMRDSVLVGINDIGIRIEKAK